MIKNQDNLDIFIKPNSRNTALNISQYIICIILFIFIAFRIFKYLESEYFVIWFDSAQYASVSVASVWTGDFWSTGIAPLYPFFLKYFQQIGIGSTPIEIDIFSVFSFDSKIIKGIDELPDYPYYIVKDNFDIISVSIFQLFFSVFSWIVFALSFGKTFDNYFIKLASIIILLFLGSESSIMLWDKHIVTESIAISLLLLTISLLIYFPIIINKNLFLILFLMALFFLSFIKITNNYLLILLVPLLAFHLRNGGYNNKFKFSIIITTILSLFILNQYILFMGDRTHVPMKDLISSRISTEGYEDIYNYFRNAGMPEVPNIVKGKLWTAPFEDYPELHKWWLSKSSKTYQKYLITHPVYFLFRPFQYTNDSNKPVYAYLTPDLHFHEQVVPNKLQIIFTDIFLWIIFTGILFLMFSIFIRKKNINIDELILPIFLLLSGTIWYLIIWHADIGELDRHLIQCAIIIRIALLMMMMLFINILFRKSNSNSQLDINKYS
jgi:hypothetical protein